MTAATIFKSSHNLDFELAPWDCPIEIPSMHNVSKFRIGTCEGLWGVEGETYVIIAVINNHRGNGHFNDVLEWFENSCKRDGYDLKIVELINKRLIKHLIKKRGFKKIDKDNVFKRFKISN